MQPLEYKNIGNEEHLTFDSIRRLVLNELSEPSERDAKQHIYQCYRCKSIHESLTSPSAIRKDHSQNLNITKMVAGILLVVALMGFAAAFLYFGSTSAVREQSTAVAEPGPPESTEPDQSESSEQVAPVLEAIDTLSQINDEPAVVDPLATDKQFDSYIETEQGTPIVKLRGIYGKITGDGQPLPGVTIMVPGSRTARVSDAGGKYYIQVPRNTSSLVFIYQGRQLVKPLQPGSRRLDIHLKTENMTYPERKAPDPDANPTNIESE